MLHLGLHVTELERSLAFYTALGYAELGRVPDTPFGSLTMLQLPDDPFVSLELVHDPAPRRHDGSRHGGRMSASCVSRSQHQRPRSR